MKKAILLSIAVVLGLVSVLALVGSADRWPAVEDPPRQGEALDARALELGQFSHSPLSVERLIREPQNTWSNLVFVFAGAYLACVAALRTSRLVGAALIAVGIGSFLYHASASRTLRHLDVAAMYGLYFAMISLAAAGMNHRLRARIESQTWLLSVAAIAFSVFAAVARNAVIFGVKPLALTPVTAAAATIFIVSLIVVGCRRRSAVRVGIAMAVFLGAVVCQVGDRPGGWLLNPSSLLQAHALWHVLAALAVLLGVQIMDSERLPHHPPGPMRTCAGLCIETADRMRQLRDSETDYETL